MKVALVILAHSNPQQLSRLVKRFDDPRFQIFIHIDRKIDIRPFLFLEKQQNVSFVKERVHMKWATFRFTLACTVCLRQAYKTCDFDYLQLISGQDYPIASNEKLIGHLEKYRGYQFMECVPFDYQENWWSGHYSRVTTYNLQDWSLPGKYLIQKLVNRFFTPRKFPEGFQIAGHVSWCMLTRDCIGLILQSMESNRKLVRFFKYTWGADEFIFNTIVYNSVFKDRIMDQLSFFEFEESRSGHTKILGAADLPKLLSSGKFFARKFDSSVDSGILDLLDKNVADLNNA
jgi:hypothetical protein